jgi:phenylacetate-CoA ligase
MAKRRSVNDWDRLGREDILRRQGAALHRYLRDKVVPNSGYYRKLFEEHRIDIDQIRSVDDLRRIPFVSKVDLLVTEEHPDRSREFVLIPDPKKLARRPSIALRAMFRGRAAVKRELEREYRPIFLTSTTGRSAEPVPFLYSQYDLDNLALGGGRLVTVLGANHDFRIVNMFPFAPHLAFWLAHYASTDFNVFNISTGGGKVMGTDGNIRIAEKTNPDAIIGMPTFLYHVLTQALEDGKRFPRLSIVILGGEKVPLGMRRKLADLVSQLGGKNDVAVVATYGFTEAKMAWGECPHSLDQESSGYHLSHDLGIMEIIDPESGEPVGDNEPGEIVYTPLDSRGSVVLRYQTGDFIDGGLTYEPCPYCHRLVPRLVGRISRQSDVRELNLGKIKGTLVDFNELENVLDDIPDVGAWQLELRKVNDDPLDLDELILHVEKCKRGDDTEFRKTLEQCIADHSELRPNDVIFYSAREMRKRQGVGEEIKEKRFVDNRPTNDKTPPPRNGEKAGGLFKSLFKKKGRVKTA